MDVLKDSSSIIEGEYVMEEEEDFLKELDIKLAKCGCENRVENEECRQSKAHRLDCKAVEANRKASTVSKPPNMNLLR